jgi:hypothetical protein
MKAKKIKIDIMIILFMAEYFL